MQTDSSASFTYLASLSASECTTTVLMPISRQARWMRSAISPRLAIRIFSNMVCGVFCECRRHAGYNRKKDLRGQPPWERRLTPYSIAWYLADHEQRLAEFHG